jgi:nitrate reductase NapE component
MNNNEKNLFYKILNDSVKEEFLPNLVDNIMHTVHKTVKKRIMRNKIFEVLGYSMLGILSVGFVGVYLVFYTDFKLQALHFSFQTPSSIYYIMISIIFIFLFIELYFRKRLYEKY